MTDKRPLRRTMSEQTSPSKALSLDGLPGSAARKLRRAQAHIDDLERVIRDYLHDPKPFEVVPEPDPNGTTRNYRFRLIRPVPEVIPEIIGDAIHNLRAALDHAICALVARNQRDVTSDHCFPVLKQGVKRPGRRIREAVGDAGGHVVEAVKREKPFEGESNHLYALHQLDITDKHRLLLTTFITLEEVRSVKPIRPDPATRGRGARFALGFVMMSEGSGQPLRDGDILYRETMATEPDSHVKVRPGIALDEPTVLSSPARVPFWLQQRLQDVAGVIGRISSTGGGTSAFR